MLLGSVALSNAEEVFRTVAGLLGDAAQRIPDGETGTARAYWIQCQTRSSSTTLSSRWSSRDPASPGGFRPARIPAERALLADAWLAPTGPGAPQARRLRRRPALRQLWLRGLGGGVLRHLQAPQGRRRHAGRRLDSRSASRRPRSIMLVAHLCRRNCRRSPRPTRPAILREVERICAAIPKDELAIQWDCTEPVGYEWRPQAPRRHDRAHDQLRRSPSPRASSWATTSATATGSTSTCVQPQDAGDLVEIANAVSAGVSRPIGWLHLPVPARPR